MSPLERESSPLRHAIRNVLNSKRPGDLLVPVLCVAIVSYIDRAFLTSKVPILLTNSDNLDIIYPLFDFFIYGLKRGVINYYQPFLWSGTRLIGDPNFQMNALQLTIGVLWDTKAAFASTDVMVVVERIVAFFGMYALLDRVCEGHRNYVRAILSLLYVFSNGYSLAAGFTSTSVHFATLPWVLYILAGGTRVPVLAAVAGLVGLLYVQFSYGQLQFSVYASWLALSFVAFWVPRREKLRALALLGGAGFAAVLLSAYYLVPLVDNLFFAEGVGGSRVAQGFRPEYQFVPPFYLARLLVPRFFGIDAPWGPAWRDGWTTWEAFSGYQGVVLTLLAVFGLFLKQVPLYFRLVFVFLIVTVSWRPGLYILYVLNLGTSVPYGRQTILLGLVAPLITAFTLREATRNRSVASAMAVWCGAWCSVFLAIYTFGFPMSVVRTAWQVVRQYFPDTPPPELSPDVAVAFFVQHAQLLQLSFGWPALFAGLSTLISTGIACGLRFQDVSVQRRISFLAGVLCLLSLIQAVGLYEQTPIGDRAAGEFSFGVRHPAEEALLAAGARVKDGPVEYRVHSDIYFHEHRAGAGLTDQVGAELTRGLAGARPQGNRFRTLPNALASKYVPVTTGYSSLIPQAQRFTELMMWTPGHPAMARAIGERTRLHPALLEVFSIKWVLRHQPALVAQLQGRSDWSGDRWEQHFMARAKLIYSDDAYRLYEYPTTRRAINIPDRVAFGENAVTTLQALEDVSQPWISTAALPERAIKLLRPDLASRITTESGIRVLHQSGRVVKIEGEAGRWTRLTVETERQAILLLGVKYDKWWTAHINGRRVPLIRANDIFAAVVVPGGRSEVLVELKPVSAWVGLFISGVAFVALFIASLIVVRRRQRSGHHGPV